MFNLVYQSTATESPSTNELLTWLPEFREKNARLGVTGLLLYKHGSFMQALEGEEDTVRDLYEIIRADPRHHDVQTVLAITVSQRQFPDWSMGFKNLGETAVTTIPGYREPKELPPWVDILPWKACIAMKLLAEFNEDV